MKILATKGSKRVIIIGSFYDQKLKLIYLNEDGEIDEDFAINFRTEQSELFPLQEI